MLNGYIKKVAGVSGYKDHQAKINEKRKTLRHFLMKYANFKDKDNSQKYPEPPLLLKSYTEQLG